MMLHFDHLCKGLFQFYYYEKLYSKSLINQLESNTLRSLADFGIAPFREPYSV